jgi:hypothetical protein
MRSFAVPVSVLLLVGAVSAGGIPGTGVLSAGAAQPTVVNTHASASLNPDHWAVHAVLRAEAAGLIDGYLPPRRSVPRHVVASALEAALRTAEERRPEWITVVAAWSERFESEFPARPFRKSPAWHGRSVDAGMLATQGDVRPGRLIHELSTGADPVERQVGGFLGADLAAGLFRNAGAHVEAEVGDRFRIRRGEVVFGVAGVAISGARTPVGYGYGVDGVVLSGAVPLDVVQFETPEPFRLPGFLRSAGRFGLHGFMGRLDEPRHPGDPYVWGAAGHWQPHPRATVSVLRASILGGDSVATPTTVGNIFRTFIGHNLLDFENEVVSAQFRWRAPTDAWMPITLYGEWGAEDAAGAWRDVPGRRAGLFFPAVAGYLQLAAGVEYATFAESCCGNPPWYRHARHTGNWAEDEAPLGHSLGGHGNELLGHANLDLPVHRVRIEGRAFTRERLSENLYVPGRDGSSWGGGLAVRWRPRPVAEIEVAGDHERGGGWDAHTLLVRARTFF